MNSTILINKTAFVNLSDLLEALENKQSDIPKYEADKYIGDISLFELLKLKNVVDYLKTNYLQVYESYIC